MYINLYPGFSTSFEWWKNSFGLCILDLETLFAIFFNWDCLEFFLKSETFELFNGLKSKYERVFIFLYLLVPILTSYHLLYLHNSYIYVNSRHKINSLTDVSGQILNFTLKIRIQTSVEANFFKNIKIKCFF